MDNFEVVTKPKSGKRINSLLLGIFSIILFFLATTVGYDIFSSYLHSLLKNASNGFQWGFFVLFLPSIITATLGVYRGIRELRGPKIIFAILGILFSLLAWLFVGFGVFWPGACC